MQTLKEIAYNCRQASFLVEKKLTESISLKERFQLRYHLSGCSVCRIYQQQSADINKALKKHFIEFNNLQLVLNADFKTALQKQIDERWKKI